MSDFITPNFDFAKNFVRLYSHVNKCILGEIKINDKVYVFKICKYFENIINHEYTIGSGINEMKEWCPHYYNIKHLATIDLDDCFAEYENPFEKSDKRKKISKECIIMEHVEGNCIGKLLRRELKPYIAYSIIKQSLLGILQAQKHCNFTHYDFHTDNVLVKKCELNSVYIYTINSKNYLVPTYGYMPVIIDFGFSYSDSCLKKQLSLPLSFTGDGFLSIVYDKHKDFKVFLCSTSSRLRDYCVDDVITSEKYCEYVKSIYYDSENLTDLDCGWETFDKDRKSLTEKLIDKFHRSFTIIEKDSESSFILEEELNIIETFESLIELPVKENKHGNINILEVLVGIFCEFRKVEKIISSSFYKLYILQAMVNSAQKVRKDYLSHDKSNDAVGIFRRSVFESIDKITEFADISIRWDKLLCHLLMLGNFISNFFYMKLNLILDIKKRIIPKRSPDEIYSDIDEMLPCLFNWDSKTNVYYWNSDTKTHKIKTISALGLSQKLDEINKNSQGQNCELILEHFKHN